MGVNTKVCSGDIMSFLVENNCDVDKEQFEYIFSSSFGLAFAQDALGGQDADANSALAQAEKQLASAAAEVAAPDKQAEAGQAEAKDKNADGNAEEKKDEEKP